MIRNRIERFYEHLDSALLQAVCEQRILKTRWLLAFGANPDTVGCCVCGLVSSLEAARRRENPSLVEILLNAGANPDPDQDEDDCYEDFDDVE